MPAPCWPYYPDIGGTVEHATHGSCLITDTRYAHEGHTIEQVQLLTSDGLLVWVLLDDTWEA